MNLTDNQKELMQFAHEYEQHRRKRMFAIIQSDVNIEQEIVSAKTRLEMLIASEKKTSFYPHKIQIRKHIEEVELYLEDLQNALRYIDELAHLDHIEYLSYESDLNPIDHLANDLSDLDINN